MDFSERLNIRIMEEFTREEIDFTFPTTTAYLEQRDGQFIHLEMDRKNDSGE